MVIHLFYLLNTFHRDLKLEFANLMFLVGHVLILIKKKKLYLKKGNAHIFMLFMFIASLIWYLLSISIFTSFCKIDNMFGKL
jgi:hypothetical protein